MNQFESHCSISIGNLEENDLIIFDKVVKPKKFIKTHIMAYIEYYIDITS